MTLRTVTVRQRDLSEAAQLLAQRAEAEGYRVVAAHPLSQWVVEGGLETEVAALLLELDAPKVTLALLERCPELAVWLPIRLLLFEQGGLIRLSLLEPSRYRELWREATTEDAVLTRHLNWLEVTLDILLRSLS